MIFKVKRAQRGDTKAFVELMEENRQAMQRVAFGYFSCEDDVADVMQQTTLNAFEKLKESTVRSRIHRGKEQIKRNLESL